MEVLIREVSLYMEGLIREVSSMWRSRLGRFPFYGGPLGRHDD